MIPNFDTATEIREAVRIRARARRNAHGLTQAELAARSGVPLGTLKRFEHTGEVSFTTLLALAEALDALDGFHSLFPTIEARTLEDVERQSQALKQVRARRKSA